MFVSRDFKEARPYIYAEEPELRLVLTSLLRLMFAQAALYRNAISVHASCVAFDDGCYMFLGRSGTGKSTHARLWTESFAGCSLLNDDNPVLRVMDGTVMAYGTPWSGKTPCYINEGKPVRGIARLEQKPSNHFVPLYGIERFTAVLPSCSSIRQDMNLQDMLHETLLQIVEKVPVGVMECLPDKEAAETCRLGFESMKI